MLHDGNFGSEKEVIGRKKKKVITETPTWLTLRTNIYINHIYICECVYDDFISPSNVETSKPQACM